MIIGMKKMWKNTRDLNEKNGKKERQRQRERERIAMATHFA